MGGTESKLLWLLGRGCRGSETGETWKNICHKNNRDDDDGNWQSVLALHMYRIIGKERKERRLHGAQGRLATVCSVWNHRAYLQVEGEEAVRKQRHGAGGGGRKEAGAQTPPPTHTQSIHEDSHCVLLCWRGGGRKKRWRSVSPLTCGEGSRGRGHAGGIHGG